MSAHFKFSKAVLAGTNKEIPNTWGVKGGFRMELNEPRDRIRIDCTEISLHSAAGQHIQLNTSDIRIINFCHLTYILTIQHPGPDKALINSAWRLIDPPGDTSSIIARSQNKVLGGTRIELCSEMWTSVFSSVASSPLPKSETDKPFDPYNL